MGLLGKLFGKRSSGVGMDARSSQVDEGDPLGISPELAPALRAYKEGHYETAIAAATPYADGDADASRLCALAYSALHRYQEAFPYWLALFEREPSAHNALQLATTSVMCGELDRGEAWLHKFDEINEQTHELSSVTARTNFISALTQVGHMIESLPHLTWMRGVYAHVRVTDDHFLYVRGIPFFLIFLEKSLFVLEACMPSDAIVEWYRELSGRLDEEGEIQLEEWIRRLTSAAT